MPWSDWQLTLYTQQILNAFEQYFLNLQRQRVCLVSNIVSQFKKWEEL